MFGLLFSLNVIVILSTSSLAVAESLAVADEDGNLLKRSEEETCHACHKTDSNSPSDPDAIKTHNSINTGSTKWGGNWGVAGGKYGAIVCTTCHTAHDTSNIYLIRETITTPDGSNFNWGSTNSVSVDFRSKSGSAGQAGTMGDDTVSHDPSSRYARSATARTNTTIIIALIIRTMDITTTLTVQSAIHTKSLSRAAAAIVTVILPQPGSIPRMSRRPTITATHQ